MARVARGRPPGSHSDRKARGRAVSAEQRKARKEELVEGLKRHFGTLRETIEDLQEAQCYFLLASQIAALIAVNHTETEAGLTTRFPRFLEATNFYQLNNNYILLSLIGICGFLPIGIVYSILMLSGRLRLHIGVLTFVTVCLSLYTLYSASIFSKSNFSKDDLSLDDFSGLDILDKCGNNLPPIIYCSRGSSILSILRVEKVRCN